MVVVDQLLRAFVPERFGLARRKWTGPSSPDAAILYSKHGRSEAEPSASSSRCVGVTSICSPWKDTWQTDCQNRFARYGSLTGGRPAPETMTLPSPDDNGNLTPPGYRPDSWTRWPDGCGKLVHPKRRRFTAHSHAHMAEVPDGAHPAKLLPFRPRRLSLQAVHMTDLLNQTDEIFSSSIASSAQ